MRVLRYTDADATQWDDFASHAPMATFLHSRRFLSYHGERFKDVSLLVEDEKKGIVGLFPAALDPSDEKRVVSHPGITYGGMLHGGALRGERMLQALDAARSYYSGEGFETLRYKAVPYIYHQVPSSDDLYALFRVGARRYRCDLSCSIDLYNRLSPAQRRKRGLKTALKHGVKVEEGSECAGALWHVLEENLSKKHAVSPVHSLNEILTLHTLFPTNIRFVVACLDSQVVAGVVLFVSARVVHAQYIASSVTGYDVCALDAVFEHCIQKATAEGARYFDFGINNENEGQDLNVGLYEFKSGFGGSGVVHEWYHINLRS